MKLYNLLVIDEISSEVLAGRDGFYPPKHKAVISGLLIVCDNFDKSVMKKIRFEAVGTAWDLEEALKKALQNLSESKTNWVVEEQIGFLCTPIQKEYFINNFEILISEPYKTLVCECFTNSTFKFTKNI